MKFVNKLYPDEKQLEGFNDDPQKGPIKMLNLLKFKEKAEYKDGRETDLSGFDAYLIYSKETAEHLKKVDGKIIFSGPIERLMIGEVESLWDVAAIVEYPSRSAMLKMIVDPEYLKSAEHREAGLEGQLNIEIL